MKTKITTLALLLCITLLNAQTIYEEIESSKLETSRQIKIQLPRNYEKNIEKKYPVFIVLDGDYLFEIVASNVDYYSYWEDMPESIVIGVNQIDSREDDNYYSNQNYVPIESGADFFEFIGQELMPYINDTFRTEQFKVAVGHGDTANFINYYLLKEKPLFQGYITLNPDFAESMVENIPERLKQFETKQFYYLSSASGDKKSIREDAKNLDASLSVIENENLTYKFDVFDDATHYSAPAHAIPKAIESIFKVYQPISKKQYKEELLTYEGAPTDYLTKKYETIKEVFGIEKQILINDFKAISAAIEKNKTFESFETLSKLARKHYPETVLSLYYIARFQEETGKPKKAMRSYKSAYIMEEAAGITKDFMLEKAEEIKVDFGY